MATQALFDAIVSNALEIFRVQAALRGVAFGQLKELEKELIKKLAVSEVGSENVIGKTAERAEQVNTLIEAAKEVIDKYFENLQLELDLEGVSESVVNSTADAIEIHAGIDAASLPATSYFKAVQSKVMIQHAPIADWWRGQAQDLAFRFAQQIRQGLSNAETNQQIISRIVGKAGAPGVMDIARKNAASLVQTGVQAVANDARRQTFQANSDVINGLMQVSTLDGHTTDICIAYSGEQWNLQYEPINGSTLPFNGGCPRHFNCRSLEIPITKTFRELGVDMPEPKGTTKASSDGQISINTSFNDFLIRKGKAYQDKMLGPGRAELWREGKITLRDLLDSNGRPLSVATLKQLYTVTPRAFFDEEYLARLPRKVVQPFKTWEQLERNAVVGKKQFDTAMGRVAEKLNLRTDLKPDRMIGKLLTNDQGFYFAGPLKSKASSLRKVTAEFEGHWERLNDVVRGTISVPNLDDVRKAIAAMRSEGIEFIARPKDRFLNPTSMGYRDILGIVRLPNGMNAEIQFHVKEMTGAKEAGHHFYEITRLLEGKYHTASPTDIWNKDDILAWQAASEKQRSIYSKAWESILNKSKGTRGN
jgi:hypothetical protein